jgi:hypothetical protein
MKSYSGRKLLSNKTIRAPGGGAAQASGFASSISRMGMFSRTS